MKRTALISAIALVLGSGASSAAVEVFDIHDAERGYFEEPQATGAQYLTSRWCVPSEDACGEAYQSGLPAMGVRNTSVFAGIPNSNEE